MLAKEIKKLNNHVARFIRISGMTDCHEFKRQNPAQTRRKVKVHKIKVHKITKDKKKVLLSLHVLIRFKSFLSNSSFH